MRERCIANSQTINNFLISFINGSTSRFALSVEYCARVIFTFISCCTFLVERKKEIVKLLEWDVQARQAKCIVFRFAGKMCCFQGQFKCSVTIVLLMKTARICCQTKKIFLKKIITQCMSYPMKRQHTANRTTKGHEINKLL